MHLDPGRISDGLQQQAAKEPDEETPGAITDPEEDLDQQHGGEEGDEEGIAAQRRNVFDLGICDIARLQRTIIVRESIADEEVSHGELRGKELERWTGRNWNGGLEGDHEAHDRR